jgi:hypothetical protein
VRHAKDVFKVIAAELLNGNNVLAVPIGILVFAKRQMGVGGCSWHFFSLLGLELVIDSYLRKKPDN